MRVSSLLNEVDGFDAAFLKQLRSAVTGRSLSRFFIPCGDENWVRLKAYMERTSPETEISEYWVRRAGDFSYSRRPDGVVCITGYFNTSFPDDPCAGQGRLTLRHRLKERLAAWRDGYGGAYGEARRLELSERFHSEYAETVLGWSSTLATVLILGGAQLIVLWIIGEYLGRLYEEAKRRPLCIVRGETPPANRESAELDDNEEVTPLPTSTSLQSPVREQ